jgi:tRNA (guanine6-N2)-methyltransferase
MAPKYTRRPRRTASARPDRVVELVFLPGLADVVRAEATELVPGARGWRAVPGRDDSLTGTVTGPLVPLLRLRTAVAPYLVLRFPVPRPRSLLSGEYFPAVVAAVGEAVRLGGTRSFRIDAAGRDSAVLRTFAAQLAQATRLPEDDESGECVVRLRPTPGAPGWEALVRLVARPLSARPWRVSRYPAAANATVAAAMVRLAGVRVADRVANPMCGSGTLLAERLLAGPARYAVGVDVAPDAVSAADANLTAAGLADRAHLLTGDIRDDGWLAGGPYDCLLADPPWGDKSGRHGDSEALHTLLLDRAHVAAAPGARLVVLTHEIRIMQRCLRRSPWRLVSETRVFHKGHHPRIYLLGHDKGAAP